MKRRSLRIAGRPVAAPQACLALAFAAGVLALPLAASANGQHPGVLGGSSNAPHAVRPGRPLDFANIDPAARALLQKMMQSERELALSGEQTTVLFRPDGKGAVTSTQTVYRDGERGYRCEFHSPARLAGELLVSRDDMSWHYQPSRKTLKIGSPRVRHLMTMVGPALHALRTGQAQAAVIGADTIAGHATQIVQITGTGQTPSGSIKLWIDPTVGAQLRTEVYDASGAMQSESYFTEVTYTPVFPPNVFDAPVVPPDTRTEIEHHDKQVNHIPSDAEAGFHVLKPTYLPAGYQFQAASLFQVTGRNAVALRYANGLSLLSIFQSPADGSAQNGETRRPRTGMVILTQNGTQFVAMGTIADSDLLDILKSMR